MERILIVDDDEGLVHFLGRFFKRQGYDVHSCTGGRTALDYVARTQFDLILLDYKMPDLNGLDTLKEIRKSQVKTPVIIMTAYGTTETVIEAMRLGAYDYLAKPFDREELRRVSADALEVNRLMKEVVSFPSAHNDASADLQSMVRIVGTNRKMQEIYKLIGQIADKDVTVLITGESGTGKELVARAIYHHSHRKNKPFLTINCAAIPDTLFESELFGYERGAFTGAERGHIGKFERCHGGTLFFDEIGDMSLSTQAKVLRILQQGEFERLGGTETLRADVRVIAATNKDLEEMVVQGLFREDLLWRLKIISIHLPPLRERIEDVPVLVDYFVRRFSREYRTPIRHVSEAALGKLKSYSWPGNVRELENCIRRAVLLCQGDVLLEEHLGIEREEPVPPGGLGSHQLLQNIERKLDDLLVDLTGLARREPHTNTFELVEKAFISRVLKECGFNQVKAAKMLGISRNTLRHRMKKYAVLSPDD